MGLFGFGKKPSSSPKDNLDAKTFTSDLPSIDGSRLPDSFSDGLDSKNIGGIPLPSNQRSSMSVNIPPLDFTLPNPDELPDLPPINAQPEIQEPAESSMPMESSRPSQNGLLLAKEDSFNTLPPISQSFPNTVQSNDFRKDSNDLTSSNADSRFQKSRPQEMPQQNIDLSEDIDNLFPKDPEWKEPDWSTYDPYAEPAIEQPSQEDFGGTKPAEDNAQEPVEDFADRTEAEIETVPAELFIRGADYKAVFSELARIGQILSTQDPKVNAAEELRVKEDEILNSGKDGMEFVYKKLLVVEKRIFI